MHCRRQHSMLSALERTTRTKITYGSATDTPPAPKQRIRPASVFAFASALFVGLVLFPGTSSAETILAFSYSGQTTGTITGNTVSGILFNTIGSAAVNTFVEAYSNGVLTFSVSGPGNLAASGTFSNVSGTFITIDETAPTFGTNPATDNLFTSLTGFTLSSAFLGDLGLPSTSHIDPLATEISATTQANGSVFSSNTQLAFVVPEPSTLSLLAFGVLGASMALVRRKKVRST